MAKQPALQIPGNGVDDDRNGYIDDVHGYNFLANTGDPMDNNFHGTHLAGARPASFILYLWISARPHNHNYKGLWSTSTVSSLHVHHTCAERSTS